MAVILILSIILTSNLKVHNVSRRQLVAETIVTKLEGIVTGMIGEEGKRYVPYLVSVLLYLGISNIIGLFGMKPPTKDLNVTAALALMSIILVEAAGIRKKRRGRMDQELHRAYRDRNTHQYPGGVHQAPVFVYAIVW